MRYDGLGRLLGVTLPNAAGESYRFTYDLAARPARVRTDVLRDDPADDGTETDAYNYTSAWEFMDGYARTIQTQQQAEDGGWVNVASMKYDTVGRPATQTVPTLRDTPAGFYLNPLFATTSRTESDYDTEGRTTVTSYDAGGIARARTITRSWALSQVVTDTENRETVRTFDVRGNLVSVVDPLGQLAAKGATAPGVGASPADHTVTYTYDLRDRITSITDPQGNVIENLYTLGTVSASDMPVGMNDPDLGQIRYTYDSNNRLITQTDGNGVALTTTYDAASRPLTIERGTELVSAWTYDTDKVGLPDTSTHYNLRDTANTAGTVTKAFSYDNRLRPTDTTWTITSPLAPDGTGYSGSTIVGFRESGAVASMTHPNGKTTGYAYDALERADELTHDGQTVAYAPLYNARGQLEFVARGNKGDNTVPTQDGGLNTQIGFEDWSGRMLSMVSDAGLAPVVQPPAPVAVTAARLYRAFTARDEDGIRNDPAGVNYWQGVATDTTNRPLASAQAVAAFFFIANTEPQAYLATLTNPYTGQPYETETVTPFVLTNEALVDLLYAEVTDTAAGARVDRQARIDALDAADANDTAGVPRPDGLGWRTWARGRLIWEQVTSPDADANPDINPQPAVVPEPDPGVQDLAYSFDRVGNITEIVDNGAGFSETQCFSYDPLDRLLTGYTTTNTCTGSGDGQGPSPFDVAYTYDPIGNITTATGTGTINGDYTYAGVQPHAVTQAGTNTYTYDAAGNQTGRPGQTLTYDSQNRLVKIEGIDGTGMETLYDAEGNRVLRRTVTDDGMGGTQTVTAMYLAGFEEHFTTGETGSETRVPHSLGGRMVGITIDGTLTLTAPDHLGSGSVTTDITGIDTTSQRYTPFGQIRDGVNTLGFDQTFTGQTNDPGTGLIDYNARHYDPLLGRFIMADPVMDGLNRYTYVANNPIRYTDPTGNCYTGAPAAIQIECDNWQARNRPDGKKTTGDSGTVTRRPGAGSVRVNLFIAREEISFFGYAIHGDGRGPSSSASLADSRATISINFETGAARADFNVSCKDTSCDDAYETELEVVQLGYLTDEGLDNYLRYQTADSRNGVRIIDGGDDRLWIVVNGKISVGPPGGGHINGQVRIEFDEDGAVKAARREGNTFPSYEGYQTRNGTTTRFFEAPEGNPGDLYDGFTGVLADVAGLLPGVPFR
jgi:RHS repeat-associated protein